MATTIKLKNGTGAPSAGDLVVAEPALDLTNKRLYTEDSGGTVIEVGTNPTSVTTGDITATGTATFAGLTTTADVSFGDNDKAVFGASSDLQIYHDSTTNDSIITESGAGNLVLQGDSLRLTNTSGVRYLQGNSGAEVNLWHNGSKKLETTSTGIDVTGTVVSDGLTVVGSGSNIRYDVASSNPHTNPTLHLENQNATDGNVAALMLSADNANGVAGSAYIYAQSETTNQKGNLLFAREDGANTPVTSMKLSSNGDISFYEDTGTTAKMFWDASAESLGIGTSSPSSPLEVAGGSSYPTTKFSRDGGSAATQGYLTTGFSAIGYSGGTGADAYLVAEHGFGFAVNAGTNALVITDGGNVGIGTSSPDYNFHVTGSGDTIAAVTAGASSVAGLNLGNSTNKADGGIRYDNSADALIFRASNAEKMRIDSSGNVGIGTSSPSKKLSIKADGGGSQLGIDIHNEGTATGDDAVISFETQGSREFTMGLDRSATSFVIAESSTLGSNQRLVIDDSGDVFIGKTGPGFGTVGTEIQGTGRVRMVRDGGTVLELNRETSDGAVAAFYKDASLVGTIATNSSRFELDGSGNPVRMKAGTSNIQVNNNTHISFDTAGGEAARFDSSGNLLVGATSFDSSNTGHAFSSAGGSAYHTRSGATVLFLNRLASTGTIVEFQQANTAVGTISVTGSATAYNTSSDQRLKDNIVDAPSASDDIDAIQVRSFDWKADGSHQKYGMVAQELQSVAPEAVTGDADSDDMMGVDYSKLVPMLVKEIQSLRARVAQLEGEN